MGYSTDNDTDDVQYILYEVDSFTRSKSEIAKISEDDQHEILPTLYDNLDTAKENREYRYSYLVVKAVGYEEKEMGRSEYSVQMIERMAREDMD